MMPEREQYSTIFLFPTKILSLKTRGPQPAAVECCGQGSFRVVPLDLGLPTWPLDCAPEDRVLSLWACVLGKGLSYVFIIKENQKKKVCFFQ